MVMIFPSSYFCFIFFGSYSELLSRALFTKLRSKRCVAFSQPYQFSRMYLTASAVSLSELS